MARERRDRGTRSVPFAALRWCAPAMLLLLGWVHRWNCEDAFIYFRVVTQILHGNGPVFNAGERVEAYSSPLWLATLTVLSASRLPLEEIAVAAGLLLSVAAVAVAQGAALSMRTENGDTRSKGLLLPVGMIVFCSLPPAWDFATSGLETGLCLLWIAVSFALLCTAGRTTLPRALTVCSVWVGLGPLVRPELTLVSAAFLAALVWNSRSVRTGARCIALALVPALAYQVFRMGYFAAMVPNTAIAKEAWSGNVPLGLRYLWDFVSPYWLPVPLLLMIALARAERTRVPLVLAPIAGGALVAAYVVYIGGDFMHARFLLSPLFCVLLPFAMMRVSWRVRSSALVLGGLAAWCVVCAALLRVSYRGGVLEGIADERGLWISEGASSHPLMASGFAGTVLYRDAVRLREMAAEASSDPTSARLLIDLGTALSPPPEPTDVAETLRASRPAPGVSLIVGRWNVGVAGYVAGPAVHLVDRLGLADPIGSRLALTRRQRPGHEKLLQNQWIIARWSPDTPPGRVGIEVGLARRALASSALSELTEATAGPLDQRRFLRNIASAPRLTRLRIPENPRQAVERFSGGGL